MTKRFSLFIFLLISVHFGMSQNPRDSLVDDLAKKAAQITIPVYDSIVKEYTVNEIVRTDRAYLVGIEDADGRLFAVVSAKCERPKGKRIRIGRKYDFLLYACFDPNIMVTQRRGHGVKYVVYVSNTFVCFDADLIVGILVTTPCLQGLHYVDPDSVGADIDPVLPAAKTKKRQYK